MSADGEITVEVSAKGVDEAAEDMSTDDDGGSISTGSSGNRGLSKSIRGGIIGGLLAVGLGGVLDILSPILEILDAFLAPLAAVILRGLQPVLDYLITRVLPKWLEFLDEYGPEIQEAMRLLRNPLELVTTLLDVLVNAIKTGLEKLQQGLEAQLQASIRELQQLPGKLKAGIMEALPSAPSLSLGGDGGGSGGGSGGDDGGSIGQTIVNISGGLPTFIDEIERSQRTDP